MMPGETRSAAPGTAADLSRCQGCASLQQNLNEYVDALITLKQKIINTDNLLTEYQKKCDELQFARRENSTLHHQVEQMLQKISPLQKCQEELGSLRAELEEKKSSLRLYQETHQEYARAKEECLKSDAQKKKLEAKVKKLEEAAFKQIQDFKQLRNEKKVLEKEFKKTQERLDEFSKRKKEKELRHIGTQISSDSCGRIDKRKVKLLLKELWLCINTAHGLPASIREHSKRLEGQTGEPCVTEQSAKADRCRESVGGWLLSPSQPGPPQASDKQAGLAELSLETEGDFPSCKNVGKAKPHGARSRAEHRNPELVTWSQSDAESTAFSDHDPLFDEDLQAAIDFFRLPPPLLSPVPSPPPISLPHLGPLPETYSGEYTDSSEDDSGQHHNSAESVFEDDTAESQNYFGSFIRNKGSSTLFKQPAAHAAPRAPDTGAVNAATAMLRGPPASPSLASEELLTPLSQSMTVNKRDISDEGQRQATVREVDKCVQTEETVPGPTSALGVETVSGHSATTRCSALCLSPLGKRPLSELIESGRKTLLSRIIRSPQAEFARQIVPNEIASESDRVRAISELFHRVSRELEMGRDGAQGFASESLESEEESAGDVADTAELEVSAGFSSASQVSSVCGGPQAASGLEDDGGVHPPSRRVSSEAPCPELRPALEASSPSSLQSEIIPISVGSSEPESNLHALSPKLGALNFSSPSHSGIQRIETVKGASTLFSVPQSVFMKATRNGQWESEAPTAKLTREKSDCTSSVAARRGLVRSSFGSVESPSWHQSAVLRRNEGASLGAKPEPRQQPSPRLQQAAPPAENGGSAPRLGPAVEGNRAVLFKAASWLPNQVSVITKQAKPAKAQSAVPEPRTLCRSEPTSATETLGSGTQPVACTSQGGRGEEGSTQTLGGVAATHRTSPEGSASRRQAGANSPESLVPVENSPCSTNSVLPLSFENIPVQPQDVVAGASVQEQLQKQSQPLPSTSPAMFGVDVDTSPATETVTSRGFPSDGEAPAAGSGSPAVAWNSHEPLQLKSQTAGAALSGGFATMRTASPSAFCRSDGETHALSQNKLPDILYCYTGLREGVEEDTEVEESEAVSCSEGESEIGPVGGHGQQVSKDDLLTDSADADALQTRPSVELGHLTSALQDVNISAFSEIDRLSTSEVVRFLESCQLRDCSSGDSVSECSSKGAVTTEMSRELREGGDSGEQHQTQLYEEVTPGTSEGSAVLEEEDCPLGDASPLPECALETLSEVLTTIGPHLGARDGGPDAADTGDLLLLNLSTVTAEDVKENALPHRAAPCCSHPSEPLPLTHAGTGSSPASAGSQDKAPRCTPEATHNVAGRVGGEEEALLKSEEPAHPGSCLGPGQAPEQSSHGLQCHRVTGTSEVISVLVNKDQNLVIEKGDSWTVINGVAVMPGVDQVILCDALGDTQIAPDPGLEADCIAVTTAEKSPETCQADSPFQEPRGDSHTSRSQEDASSSGPSANFDKSRLRNRPVRPSVRISSQIYSQDFEPQIAASDHTYYNSKLEPCSKSKIRAKLSNKDQPTKPGKPSAPSRAERDQSEVSQSLSGERGGSKPQQRQPQTILANADTSTPPECSTDTLSKIRQEVGAPLPPLLAPLIATPPRTLRPVSPLGSSCSPSSPASPVGRISPLGDAPTSPMTSPLPEDSERISPSCAAPSPSAVPASERALSSPLQFCAATPKHALPVPGRLPARAPGPTAVGGTQENSVKILDTMYPELSARARTLSILKGSTQPPRGPPADCKSSPGPVGAVTRFRAIASTSTAFVKTAGSGGSDCNQDKSGDSGAWQDSSGKRALSASIPRSAKRLRLDSGSPESQTREAGAEGGGRNLRRNYSEPEVVPTNGERSCFAPAANTVSKLPLNPKEIVGSHSQTITSALKRIAEASFDLLPVIRSHVYVGNISKKPVMRDQEKEVVYEFSTTKKHLAECLLHSILSELHTQKTATEHSYVHALCRVYVGVCRQLGDLERARLFCYSILKEDFPESDKLTLFIANMWHDIFMSQSVINKAMQLVARQRAKGEVLNCLRAFLNWEKNAPVDVGFMVSKLLLTIQLCPKTEFQSSEKFGEDLSDNTWECIFAIDLLCCHQKWIWTHDNIISKELWPVMDKWVKYRKGHANITYTPDIIIASVLRLIGRLGQLGLKEGFPSAVKNISSVIGMFIQHARDEDIPWGVQLAAVYALCDLSPSNPTEIAKILEAWRKETVQSVPAAVVSSLEEAGALCTEECS